jgi:Concanavalin A-like lectin/glucanases superfamily
MTKPIYSATPLVRNSTNLASFPVITMRLSLKLLAAIALLLTTNGAVAQTCIAPPPGLLRWYPGDGNANDFSGAHNATLQSGATFATGMVDQAFSLDGVGAFVEAPDDADLTINSLTIDAWVKLAAGGNLNSPILVSKYDSSVQNGVSWVLFMYPTGQIAFVVYGPPGDSYRYVLTDSPALVTDVWQHVAATFDITTQLMVVYVDGVPVPSSLVAGSVVITSITDSVSPVRIGTAKNISGQPTEFWTGLIDEVEIFGRALAASEIQAIFNAGSAGKCKVTLSAQSQPPINADGTSVFNVRRGVVPVKFTLNQDGVATCDLPQATTAVTRTAGGTIGPIDESTYSGPADTGSNFRIDSCQYVYNLSASALGVGTYRMDILINGQLVGSATFALR